MSVPTRRERIGRAAQARGVAAESLVCERLLAEGWQILARRARTPYGEIDIVARLRATGLLAFVEVKARDRLPEAAACLPARQRSRLVAAAEILMDRHPEWAPSGLRFDLVILDAAGRMRRIADAFRVGD